MCRLDLRAACPALGRPEGAGRVSRIRRVPTKASAPKGWGEPHRFRTSGRAPLPALGRAASCATTAVFWTMLPCLTMGVDASRECCCGLFLDARNLKLEAGNTGRTPQSICQGTIHLQSAMREQLFAPRIACTHTKCDRPSLDLGWASRRRSRTSDATTEDARKHIVDREPWLDSSGPY